MTDQSPTPILLWRAVAVPAFLALVVSLGPPPSQTPTRPAPAEDATIAAVAAQAASPVELPPPAGEAPPLSSAPPPPVPEPELGPPDETLADSALREVFDAWQGGERDIPGVEDGAIRVEIVHRSSPADLVAALEALGGSDVVTTEGGVATATLPVAELLDAEQLPEVDLLRLPSEMPGPAEGPADLPGAAPAAGGTLTAAAGSRGADAVKRVRASAWHKAGYTGKGVKIGILDSFSRSAWHKARGSHDVPPHSGSFCRSAGVACDIWGGGSHGVSVAEAIHDLAPGAKLYLASAGTIADGYRAIDYFKSKGVRIISRSLSGWIDGYGNGTGPSAELVDYAVSKGMTWFNSAGNRGVRYDDVGLTRKAYWGGYWRGVARDDDADGWVDFQDPRGNIASNWGVMSYCGAGLAIEGLRWDDWGWPNQSDYNLYVYAWRNGAWVLIDGSENLQYRHPEMPPTEHVPAPKCIKGEYLTFGISTYAAGNGTTNDTLELFVHGLLIDYASNPASAGQPYADSKNRGEVTVGALNVSSGRIIDYSSRGPLNDGRIKPDVSASSEFTSTTGDNGRFGGTSAATPVTSGVAAMILQRYPKLSPKQLGDYMRKYAARDRSVKGPDNNYGAGEIRMPLLNTKKPRISGTRSVGHRLYARAGSWNESVKRSYTWLRNGKAIKGATSKSYKLRSSDRGKRISVRELARKSGYRSLSATSSRTSKVR